MDTKWHDSEYEKEQARAIAAIEDGNMYGAVYSIMAMYGLKARKDEHTYFEGQENQRTINELRWYCKWLYSRIDLEKALDETERDTLKPALNKLGVNV